MLEIAGAIILAVIFIKVVVPLIGALLVILFMPDDRIDRRPPTRKD